MQSLELRRRFQGGDKHSGVGSRHGILTEFLFLELRAEVIGKKTFYP